MSDLRSPVSDYLSHLEPHEWRFETTERGPVLRCYAIGDGRKIPVHIELNMKDGRIVKVNSVEDSPVADGSLCVKGRFGWDFVHSEDRLTTPLIKKDGEFVEATWDEALDLVAAKFKKIKNEHGGDSLAVLSSAKCTNEENYLMQKFARTTLGTNNVDHCARL